MSDVSDRPLVSVDNFVRAETDTYLAGFVKSVGIGKFAHRRTPVSVDHQDVVRINRDTLYSSGVFDLDAGPVTIQLPRAGHRFMSLQVISQDHYTPLVTYDSAPYTISRQLVGTRYACLLARTLVAPDSPTDVNAVHALQDAIEVSQASPGEFVVPEWDPATLTAVRNTLRRVASVAGDSTRAFGRVDEVDPIPHLIGAATGWGGNPVSDAKYVGRYPDRNDGTTVHRLTVSEVPVDGFWSISVYNEAGYFEPNPANAYTVNNLTAIRDMDGTVTVQFGGTPNGAPNHLPITPGWNYVARLYRPRPEVLDGTWRFPEPVPVG